MSAEKKPRRTGPFKPVDRTNRLEEKIEEDIEEEWSRVDESTEQVEGMRKRKDSDSTDPPDAESKPREPETR